MFGLECSTWKYWCSDTEGFVHVRCCALKWQLVVHIQVLIATPGHIFIIARPGCTHFGTAKFKIVCDYLNFNEVFLC